jgi:hypothetical protein
MAARVRRVFASYLDFVCSSSLIVSVFCTPKVFHQTLNTLANPGWPGSVGESWRRSVQNNGGGEEGMVSPSWYALAVMSATITSSTPNDNPYHSAYPYLSYPPPKLSVGQLLDLSLPPSSGTTVKESSTWFCDEAPQTDNFPPLVLPSSTVCAAMIPLLNTALSSGKMSVCHPTHARARLPLEVARVYFVGYKFCQLQAYWRIKRSWLCDQASLEHWPLQYIDHILQVFDDNPIIDGLLPRFRQGDVTIIQTANMLLSDRWLSTSVLGCLVETARSEVDAQAHSIRNHTVILDATLSAMRPQKESLHLDSYATTQKIGCYLDETKCLVFPWNVNNTHWIIVEADMLHHILRIGDSSPSCTQDHLLSTIESIKSWLGIYLPHHTWCFEPSGIPILSQRDNTLCGPAVINALLARFSAGHRLWPADKPRALRAYLFSRITSHIHQVCDAVHSFHNMQVAEVDSAGLSSSPRCIL